MKIAVFHNLPSGGAKRALYNLVRELVRMGHSADLYVPSTADETFLSMRGIVANYSKYEVHRTFGRRIRSAMGGLPAVCAIQKAVAEDINARDYDVVLCEQDRYTYSPFLLRYLAKPSVFYCQQPGRSNELFLTKLAALVQPRNPMPIYKRPLDAYRRKWCAQVEKINASLASCVVANSYFSREAILRSYGINASVSYLGTDTEFFRPLSLPRENFILSVGTCAPHKGFDFLVRSIALISSNLRPRLVIASNAASSGWQSYLGRLADGLGVRIDVRNEVADSELLTLYNQASVFVYAPYLEPFGLAPIEAMACGTPVVAVKEGGVRESVLDGLTGTLTERDEQAFAEALSDVLSDKYKRRLMGESGVEAVRGFWTWGQAGKRLDAHLRGALELGPQPLSNHEPKGALVPHPVRSGGAHSSWSSITAEEARSHSTERKT